MFDIAELAKDLRRDASGIWRPNTAREYAVSFPTDGHDSCFAIEDESVWFQHRNSCITTPLRRLCVTGPLADVGGGNGAVSIALERSGIGTVVIEPGEQGSRNARKRGLRNVVCATLADSRFREGSFPAAGLFDVLEHVADERALLGDVWRILRPGGHLCITVPAFRWLWSRDDEMAGHYRRYTLRQLHDVLEQNGFSVRYETYLFASLTAPAFVIRSLRSKLLRANRDDAARAADRHLMSPALRRTLALLLGGELVRIRAGRGLPFGTSCLAVAVKA